MFQLYNSYFNLWGGKMEKEDRQSLGGSIVTELFQTDAQRYLAHLKQQFEGTQVEGLVAQVVELLKDTRYRYNVERAVINLKSRAEHSGFIRAGNALTRRAKFHLGAWYPLAQGGLPAYQGYAQRGLDNIVRGYTSGGGIKTS